MGKTPRNHWELVFAFLSFFALLLVYAPICFPETGLERNYKRYQHTPYSMKQAVPFTFLPACLFFYRREDYQPHKAL